MFKHVIFTLFSVSLVGCGGSDDVTTSPTDPVVNHAPATKLVTKDLVQQWNENELVSIYYNVIDPDSTTFSVSAKLVNNSTVPIFVNQNERKLSFTTPYIQGDIVDSIAITVTDSTGLSSSDSLEFTIKESVNTVPTLNIVFEQEYYKETDVIQITYSLNADDVDGNNDDLVITQNFYNDNPETCRPVCQPIPYTILQHEGRYAATLETSLTENITQIWLHAEVEDFMSSATDSASFFVVKRQDAAPIIITDIEKDIIPYAEKMNFAFNLTVEDYDSESLSITKNIYSENPATCRPICQPVNVTWSNHKTRHVGSFTLSVKSENTPMWLNIVASDSVNETETNTYFSISREPNRPPTIEITLEKSTIFEKEGLVLPYSLLIQDLDHSRDELVITQKIYDGDPSSCLPLCNEVSAEWKEHNGRYVAILDATLEHDETFWLLSSVTDGEDEAQDIASFDVKKSVNSPPSVTLSLESNQIQESDPLLVRYSILVSDEENDDIKISHAIYDDNPLFCLPVCRKINIETLESGSNFAAEFSYTLEKPITEFWLTTEISDGVNKVDKSTTFYVNRRENTPPAITVTPDQTTLNEGDAFSYLLDIYDAEGDTLSVDQLLFTGNPSTCRPACKPVSAEWLQYENKHAIEISDPIEEETVQFWLYISASDGEYQTEKTQTFTVIQKSKGTPPTLSLSLDQTSIIEGEILQYTAIADDADGDEVTLTHLVFDGDPEFCRPVCQPVSADFSRHNNRYAVQILDEIDEPVKNYWLEVEATDGTYSVSENRSFSVSQETNSPPEVNITLSRTSVNEGDYLNYTVVASDPEGETVTLSHAAYSSDPSFCKPACQPVNANFSKNGEQYAVQILATLSSNSTQFWLEVAANDGENESSDIKSFSVTKDVTTTNSPPEVVISLKNPNFTEGNPALYTVITDDADGDTVTVKEYLYLEDPMTCRPTCQPVDADVSISGPEKNRYTALPEWNLVWDIDEEAKVVWVFVEATDGKATVVDSEPIIVYKRPDDALVIDVTLVKKVVISNSPVSAEYYADASSPVDGVLNVAQEIYLDDPYWCECDPIPSSQTSSAPSYTATFDVAFPGDSLPVWLKVDGSDNSGSATVVRPFTARPAN